MIHACQLCKFKDDCVVRPTSNCADCDIFVREETQTWGNKIRSMSDEELAEFLAKLTICELCEYCGEDKCNRTGGDYLCTSAMAAKTMCKWLKSEVKE